MTRMTWIKTNFLWMMYRSDWARSKDQEMILGIWLKRTAFDRMIKNHVPTSYNPESKFTLLA
jgi:hypothetical protein